MAVTVSLRAKELQQFRDQLVDLADSIKRKVAGDALTAGATLGLEEVKALVPHKTGNLKKSLTVKRKNTRDDVGAYLYARRGGGYAGYYAHLVEKGHQIYKILKNKKKVFVKHYAGQPFMRPGIEQNFDKIVNKIIEKGEEGIKKAAKKR